MIKKLKGLFTKHPHSIAETYPDHLVNNLIYAGLCLLLVPTFIWYAVFPFICGETAKSLVRWIVKDIEERENGGGV